jgi:hypothetical protein
MTIAPMPPTPTPAAIWFAADGHDPAKGQNGNHLAAPSFLRWVLAHTARTACVSAAHTAPFTRPLRAAATGARPDVAAAFVLRRAEPPDRRPRQPAPDPGHLRHHRPRHGNAVNGFHPHVITSATLGLAKVHVQKDTP